MLENVLAAVQKGNWWAVASAMVVVSVWAIRTYVGSRYAWLRSDPAGVLLAFLASLAGLLFTSLMAGSGMSVAMLVIAAKVAFGAIGGYSAVRKGVAPLWHWLAVKAGMLPPSGS